MIYKLIVLTLFLVSSTSGKGQVPGGKEVKHLEWTEGKSPTHNFRFNIALSSADKVFVVGGQNDGAIETYDPGTNSWSSLKSMPTERIFISGAVIANSIYVIGGIDRSLNYSAAVESYDITENAWSMCRSLPMAASRLAAVSYRGKIYVFGGLEGTN
jgi:N-acetylneuraminic acid mutarotase